MARKTTVRSHIRKQGRHYVRVRSHMRQLPPSLGRVGLNKPFQTRKGVFHLPVRTAVIVPSTTRKDKKISRADFQKRINETRRFLAKKNGGYTSVRARGGYVTKNGKLIKEDVAIVESFATKEAFSKNKAAVAAFLKAKGKSWGQESMGYEHEDDLYYVDT